MPSGDDFQRDPMAALTKGFGWLSSTVSKQANNVNKSYIQPGMKSFQDGEFAAQARAVGMQAGNYMQQGARGVNDQFNKFVDPEFSGAGARSGGGAPPEKKDFWDSFGQAPSGPPQEKKDFWDDFAAAGEAKTNVSSAPKPTSIGTSAMKNKGPATGAKKDDENWGEW